jgi:hypothetical protein
MTYMLFYMSFITLTLLYGSSYKNDNYKETPLLVNDLNKLYNYDRTCIYYKKNPDAVTSEFSSYAARRAVAHIDYTLKK